MMLIPLTKGSFARIDEEDRDLALRYDWQVSANTGKTLYAIYVRKRKSVVEHISMHRLILGARTGEIVDHRDGDGLNNTRANLRLCSSRQNAENRTRYAARKRAAGGYLGVTYHPASRLWFASIHAGVVQSNGERKRISLKYHATSERAARIFDSAAKHYFGEFAALNFPGDEPAPFDLATLRGSSLLSQAEKRAISGVNMAAARRARWGHQ